MPQTKIKTLTVTETVQELLEAHIKTINAIVEDFVGGPDMEIEITTAHDNLKQAISEMEDELTELEFEAIHKRLKDMSLEDADIEKLIEIAEENGYKAHERAASEGFVYVKINNLKDQMKLEEFLKTEIYIIVINNLTYMYSPTAKGYFSGAGGLEIGMMQAGVKVIQSLDIDKDSIDCMRRNPSYFGHTVLKQDIKELTVLEQPATDIQIFTWPCTKYSAIADIHNARTGDDLFLHGFRHIAIERPEMYVVENVPGMKKFKVVMEAITKLPDYYVHVFCPVDANNWLPQNRKRLIVIGTRKPFNISAPAFQNNKVRLKDIVESNPEISIPDYVLSRINGKYRDKPIIVDPDIPGAVAPTCVAHYSKDLGTRLVVDHKSKHGVRPFTVREYARLQGFPDDFHFENKMSSYRLIGNAVAVNMARWIGEQSMKYFN